MQVNLEIKKYLADNGISQAFVSKKSGIEPAKLSLSLQGERRLTLDEYAVICGVLGVDTNKFLHPRLPDNVKHDREMAAIQRWGEEYRYGLNMVRFLERV